MSDEQQMRCPECGDDAVRESPADLVAWEAHSMPQPEWSHRDGTSLCPVIGQSGYQPAKPEPKDAETAPDHSQAEPDSARADPSATFAERLQAQLAARAGDLSREHDARLPAGTRGVIGRGHMTRTIARLGELDRSVQAEPEPEAGA